MSNVELIVRKTVSQFIERVSINCIIGSYKGYL